MEVPCKGLTVISRALISSAVQQHSSDGIGGALRYLTLRGFAGARDHGLQNRPHGVLGLRGYYGLALAWVWKMAHVCLRRGAAWGAF